MLRSRQLMSKTIHIRVPARFDADGGLATRNIATIRYILSGTRRAVIFFTVDLPVIFAVVQASSSVWVTTAVCAFASRIIV
ncbi:MAG: hypothetical protein QOH85_1144, partial [Acidobacteriaceae bacterium]|nr:hypothetical protein [Acidobacteriaceae bacterium]